MVERLRIFISSPGDVAEERRRAALVIGRLRREFQRFFDLSAVLWEYEPMLASGHFQDNIERPSATDIVVLILWSRLGTPLPADRYKGIDGRTPVTGTEWEFEEALQAHRVRGTPDLLVYRKTVLEGTTRLDDPDAQRRQWDALRAFWTRHFEADGEFKAAFNNFDDIDGFEATLEAHLRTLLRGKIATRGAGGQAADIVWHQGSPFRGLSAFEVEHSPVFFGRAQAEREVTEALVSRAAAGCAFVLVLGASGSGKSSLVRAGVLPALMAPGVVDRTDLWRYCIWRPSETAVDLFDGLAAALIGQRAALPELPDAGVAAAGLAERLRTGTAAPTLRDGLAAAAAKLRRPRGAPPATAHLVLVVDQLEELFASGDAAARERLAALLEHLARGGVWVLATMRSDFYHRLAEIPRLRDLAAGAGQYHLLAPRPAELEQMIRLPAAAAGLRFEIDEASGIGLDAMLLESAAKDPSALPLLEFALDGLYRADVETGRGTMLTLATYRSAGGLEGAISARAEAVCAALPAPVLAALPSVLRALVTATQGADGAVTARPASLSLFAEGSAQRRLVDAFAAADARLLVKAGDAGGTRVRLAHEALLTHWARARDQIAADLGDLQVRARLEQAAALWERAADPDKDSLLLQPGLPLAEAESLAARRRDDLAGDLLGFVEASRRAATARERRRIRRLQITAGVFGVAALVAATLGWLAVVNEHKAEARRIEAEGNLEIAQNLTYTMAGDMAARIAAVDDLAREQRRRIVERSEQLFAMLSRTSAGTPALRHEQATALVAFADAWMLLGEPATAEARASDAQAILAELTAQNPDQPEWQHTLALSYEKLGDAQQNLGDLDGALAAHQETLRIAQLRLAQAPADYERQRDAMLAYSRLGLVKLQRDGAVGAAADLGAALGLAERRAADGADAGAQRDLQWLREQMAPLR
ncbi:MAG: AAA family ATPase [Proteobacteria bacterium]|nr:AAA family ATPase [Pseudomonadota bacterium]